MNIAKVIAFENVVYSEWELKFVIIIIFLCI